MNGKPEASHVTSLNEYKKKRSVNIIPRNTRQEELLSYLNDESKKVIIATGPAGTGKTYLVTLYAIWLLKNHKINKIVITRPAVAVDENHGFLPGDINDKMQPWVRPMIDVFEEYFSVADIKSMIENNIIEISPLAYIRGRTFKDTFVILDESQLTTANQMKAVLTRIGSGCRMAVTGDIEQADYNMNGLRDFIERLESTKTYSTISCVKFKTEHVERSQVVKDVLSVYG